MTGRYESPRQTPAPWGYADDFDESKVPPSLRVVVDRIRSSPDYHVGALRDITINYRHSRFFKLDAHLDPMTDGPHVFILGLLSGTVITFSPVDCPTGTVSSTHRCVCVAGGPLICSCLSCRLCGLGRCAQEPCSDCSVVLDRQRRGLPL